ncbi:6,7-dimethyl-8-ribityllumazine synthase [Propionibacteriaceae bacterium Y1923]|uniref:6,7-dimethyl-8-ribityllumazine synthase n=1 Tax=Aestuariimicrobium sp. Y1814 TaxID=3418742 RepID=UPI003C21D72A
MVNPGIPILSPEGAGRRIAIVASQWHTTIMDGLINGAQQSLARAGVDDVTLVRVPGSFELPVACARLADHFDALVALGVVIRGDTPHFDYVCQAATHGLTQVAINTGKPVGFGVLTCDDEAQALDRAGLEGSSEDKGAQAVEAVLMTLSAVERALAGLTDAR